MGFLYISTDSNEVGAILGITVPRTLLIQDYKLSKDCVYVGKYILPIINLPVKDGKDVKQKYRLEFNPISVIEGELNKKERNSLIGRLVKKGLFVAEVRKDKIKQHFPKNILEMRDGIRESIENG